MAGQSRELEDVKRGFSSPLFLPSSYHRLHIMADEVSEVAKAVTPAHNKAQEEFSALEADSSVADTVFRIGNDGNTRDFQVVGALFAIRSPYFKRLLFGRLQEA